MHMPVKLVRWLFKWLIRLSVIVVAVVVTIYVVRAFDSRRLPDLKPWHTVVLENEFRADEVPADFDFASTSTILSSTSRKSLSSSSR